MSSPVKQYSKNLLAGVMIGLLMAISSVSFSAFIYNGELSQFLLIGATSSLIGTAIIAIVLALGSSSKIIIGEPQDIFAVILALVAPAIAASLIKTHPQDVLVTIIATTMIMALFLGISMYLIGLLKLGKLVRYIPYSVIGGFLAGTGWLVLQGTFSVLTPYSLHINSLSPLFSHAHLAQWLWPLLYGIVMLLGLRYISHFLVFPALLLIGMILFYGFIWLKGIPFQQATAHGWMMGPFPEGKLANIPTWQIFNGNVHWHIIFKYLPDFLTLSIIGAISILLNISSFEIMTKSDMDINRELKVTGIANILTGFLGGLGGYHSLSTSKINYKFGTTSRYVGVLTGIISVIILFLGTPLLTLLPKFLFGALLFYIALDFLVEWLVDAWKKLSFINYAIIVIIAVTIASQGLLIGLFVGLMLSLFLFFFQFSRLDAIRLMANGKIIPSNVDRNEYEKNILNIRAQKILIPVIAGYLFFGNASHIIQAIVQACSYGGKAENIDYIIIDFSRINGFEASCITSFIKLLQFAKQQDITVVFSNLPKAVDQELERFFSSEGDFYQYHVNETLESAVEWCEEQILKNEKQDPIENELSLVKPLFPCIDDVSTLLKYFEKMHVEKDHILIKQGDKDRDLYLLVSGGCSVYLGYKTSEEVLLRRFRRGTIIGEMSLYNNKSRTATVVCDQTSVLYKLSYDAFEKMREQNAKLTQQFDMNIIQHLSNRIGQLNNFVSFIKAKLISSNK